MYGMEGNKCIHWVSSSKVCKMKEEGGLRIRDVDTMSILLLMKCKWRIITEENAMWFNLLVHRYSNLVL